MKDHEAKGRPAVTSRQSVRWVRKQYHVARRDSARIFNQRCQGGPRKCWQDRAAEARIQLLWRT